MERNLGIIATNLTLLDDFFDRHPDTFAWQRPKAGPIAFPQLRDEDSEDFCERLVREAGVLLLPGTVFDDQGNHVRIGFGRRDTLEALGQLEAYLHR